MNNSTRHLHTSRYTLHLFLRDVMFGVLLTIFCVISPAQQARAFDVEFYAGNDIFYYDPTDCDKPTGGDTTGAANMAGNDNIEKIFNFLYTKYVESGAPPDKAKIMAAGAVGNIAHESAGGQPDIIQGGRHSKNPADAGGGGYGLIQWTPGKKLLTRMEQAGISGDPSTLETQLAVIWWLSTNTSETSVKNMVKDYPNNANDPRQAADYYERTMEGAGKPMMSERYKHAEAAMKLTPSGAPATDSSSADSSSCECGEESQQNNAGAIVLDPGHSGTNNQPTYDKETNLQIGEYPNPAEMKQVFETAEKVKKTLEGKGYKVMMTKEKVDDTKTFRDRVDVANKNNAALAVSIHNTPGQFGSESVSWVTPQEVGRYRVNKDGKQVKFEDKAVADKSLEYSKKMVEARTKAEGGAQLHPLNFAARGGYIAPGNIAMVQLLSKVPWVYNEVGQSGFNSDKYAEGIANGIMAAIPASGGGVSGATSGATSGSTSGSATSGATSGAASGAATSGAASEPTTDSSSSGGEDCGSTGGNGDIVATAEAEVAKNVREYDANVLKYTTGRREAWCADFVSWVYKEAGTPMDKGPYKDNPWQHPSVLEMQSYFKANHTYFPVGSQTPQPGDVAFYIGGQTPDGGSTRHVNIVHSVQGDTMTTIGGNESNQVKKSTRKIKLGASSLVGFGRLKK